MSFTTLQFTFLILAVFVQCSMYYSEFPFQSDIFTSSLLRSPWSGYFPNNFLTPVLFQTPALAHNHKILGIRLHQHRVRNIGLTLVRVTFTLPNSSMLISVWENYVFNAFFWVIPWRLNFICRCFGTFCSIFVGR